jgi:hypothetical protein
MEEKEVKQEKTKILYILIAGFIIVSVGLSLVFSFVDIDNLDGSNGTNDSNDGDDDDSPVDNSTDDGGGG